MVFLMALRRMERQDITAHGCRSSFRDWASERTNTPSAVCEAALAHTVRDKTEAAYNRSDLFERRRKLMGAVGSRNSELNPSGNSDPSGKTSRKG
jgi:integrase